MINVLKKTLQIDYAYSVNSFIYILQRLPIFNDLLTKDAYSSKMLKSIVGVFGIIMSTLRVLFLKFMYFFAILYLSYKIAPDNVVKSFFNIYFFLTILGLFINNKLLNTSKKKYFSLILFNVDSSKFLKASLFWMQLTNLILNSIFIFLFMYLLDSPNIIYGLVLILLSYSTRIVGEALNIKFYKKYNYIWYSNSTLYFPILIGLLLLALLPYINVFIRFRYIAIITIILFILSIPSLIYLLKIKDYKLIYKQLSNVTKVMNSKNDKDYLKQAMVEVKNKDKVIDEKLLKDKKGYDFFNTIFFERHKEILLRSAKKYSIVLIILYIIFNWMALSKDSYLISLNLFINFELAWFIIIMFIVNRGAIITQAMFFNCDHAMLNYNFYREEKTIISLFKKRLSTVVKVNLLPAVVIGLGNISILLVSKNYDVMLMLTQFVYIMSLSILYSVHYLVIYYLLQPFNKEMEVKKASYSFMVMITYGLTYSLVDIELYTPLLAIITLLITVIYTVVSMFLVKKFAPKTFKLN